MTWQNLGKRFLPLALLASAMASPLLAAPALTIIQDTLYKADGTPFEGVLLINWRTFEGPDSSNIPTNSLSVRVVSGTLYAKLVPTTTSPQAAFYSVRYVADGAVAFTELWSVPVSATPLRVNDVRISWPPTPGTPPVPDLVVNIEDVTGLPEALDARPTKGLTYIPSRAAVIGSTGEIEATSGSPGDCVLVDGTSAPCGSGGGTAPVWVDAETPSGAVDGVNNSFTLTEIPNPATSLRLYRNGILLSPSVDYTLGGAAITMLSGATPQTGDALVGYYRTQ